MKDGTFLVKQYIPTTWRNNSSDKRITKSMGTGNHLKKCDQEMEDYWLIQLSKDDEPKETGIDKEKMGHLKQRIPILDKWTTNLLGKNLVTTDSHQ